MSNRSVTRLTCALMLCIGGVASAQQSEDRVAVAQRSFAMQAQVAAIEADRAGFMSRLLTEWGVYLDNSKYDLQRELGDIVSRAPAWQLYGASLVGDFNTMVDVLRGVRPAGPYINAFQAAQQKSSMNTAGFASTAIEVPGPGSNLIGSTSDELVFTPIAPCRVADTRGTGARTGMMAANSTRTFDLTTDGLAEGQGGVATCPGLPSFSHLGWAVNVTVTGYTGFGWLTAWGYTGTEPTASVINYSASLSPAIANGLTLIGCYACADDITIRAANAATHVIIDVVGYYSRASISGATVTRIAGTPVNMVAGGAAFGTGGACPAGTVLIGGENDFNGTDVNIGETRQSTTTTWTMWMINHDGVTRAATVYSRCMDQPILLP